MIRRIITIKHIYLSHIMVWCLILMFSFSDRGFAQESVTANDSVALQDTIDLNNPPEDFIIASLLVASPGDVLYSRVGHVAIRMQCPIRQLDYVFSYEAEPVTGQVIKFLAGRLKMGLFAIAPAEYLEPYKQEGRGVKEYTLNLPIAVRQNLWRILDNHLMEGANLPYDYLTRGCAHSVLMMLKEGLDTIPINYGPWPEKFENCTRRELTELQLSSDSPWTWCFLNLINNGTIDQACSMEEKIIMPTDLVEVMQRATVQGQPILADSPMQLLPELHKLHNIWLRPWVVALLLLIASLICSLLHYQVMSYTLLTIQTAIGFLTCYLVMFSDLCCTEWNWLIIPFNPLSLFFWKWRIKWSLPYAILITVWALTMILWPHTLTDPAYIILAINLAFNLYIIHFFKEEHHTQKKTTT